MPVKHEDYPEYETPNKWTVEEDNDTTSIFSNDGDGALTLSYFPIFEM